MSLEKNDLARETFDASVARHMNDYPCDLDNASASLARLTKCVSAAARETLPVKQPKPLRNRAVDNALTLCIIHCSAQEARGAPAHETVV